MRLPLDQDLGEQVQSAIEKTTGERGTGCPWVAASAPFVRRVQSAYRHWTKGELSTRRPSRLPEAIMRGIEIFDSAINSVQSFDIRNPRQTPTTDPHPPHRGVRIQRESVHAARRRAKP